MTQKEVTQLSYEITGLAIKVHKELGPGLLESVYQQCLEYELRKNGYHIQNNVAVPVTYMDKRFETNLRLDLLVNDTVIVELKAVERLQPIYEAQLLSYMKLLKKPQGLLINFFTDNISKSMKPFVNEYYRNLPE